MITKDEVLYGKLAVISGFIAESDLAKAVEIKRVHLSDHENGKKPPPLDQILRSEGMIDDKQHDFLSEKLSVRTPKQLGGYEIVKKLGQGAMGAVYKAHQKSLGRDVALKVLGRELKKNATFVKRFEREAMIVGKLNHPNIVAGIDRGVENDIYYYVMEFVEGRPLDQIIEDEGAMAEKPALEIVLQMARALEHAHEHGLVHRDIKPDNIIITDEAIAKLCDMGLAKPEDDDAHLTQVGTSMGTPYYISPEQALGRTNEIAIQSDIYSLGATLWYALVADVPFTAETPAMVLAAHVDKPLPNPKQIAPHLSNATCRLLRKMMAKEISARHENPTALIKDISAIIDGTADQGPDRSRRGAAPKRGPRPAQRASRPGQRTRRATQGGARSVSTKSSAGMWIGIAAVVLIVGFIGILVAGSGNDTDPEPTDQPPKVAEKDQPGAQVNVSTPNALVLERCKRQISDIESYATKQPEAFTQIIERFDALAKTYAATPEATTLIGKSRAVHAGRAEQAAMKLQFTLDNDVTRLLGQNRKGDALDLLRAFPATLLFTKAGKEVDRQRTKMDADLAKMLEKLLADAKALAGQDQHQAAITLLEKDKAKLDRTRRDQVDEALAQLKDTLRTAATAETDAIRRAYGQKQAEVAALIAKRQFKAALRLIEPLAKKAADHPKDASFDALRLQAWDLALLAKLEDAHNAGLKARPRKSTDPLSPSGYIGYAEDGKSLLGKDWYLATAVFYFYEKQFETANESLEKARAAGSNVKPLMARLRTALAAYLEVRASRAWTELQDLFDSKEWLGLSAGLEVFLKRFGGTEFAKSKADTISTWRATIKSASENDPQDPEDPEPTANKLEKLLNGKIIKWDPKTRRLVIEYSWKTKDELKDWKAEGMGRWTGGSMEIKKPGQLFGKSQGGFVHTVGFTRPLKVQTRVSSDDPRMIAIGMLTRSVSKRYVFGFNFRFGRGGGRGGGRGETRYDKYIVKYDGDIWDPEWLSTAGGTLKEKVVYSMSATAIGKDLRLYLNGKTVLKTKDETFKIGKVSLNAWNDSTFGKTVIDGIVDKDWLEKFEKSGGKDSKIPGAEGEGDGDGDDGGRRDGGGRNR